MKEYRIGPSQVLRCTDRLTDEEEALLKSYLNGNYTQVREQMARDASTRKLMHRIFSTKALRSSTEMILYRSQTQPFSVDIATSSIISTVREVNMSDRFGSLRYVFLVAPNVPYLEIEWNLGANNGRFTEVILPMNGYFRKSTTKQYPEFDAVYRFDTEPITASYSKSASASAKKVAHISVLDINAMSLRGLEMFRALPKRKQTKRALLEVLGYADEFDLDIAGDTFEKDAYNNALSRSLST